jgi:hypothetical protein
LERSLRFPRDETFCLVIQLVMTVMNDPVNRLAGQVLTLGPHTVERTVELAEMLLRSSEALVLESRVRSSPCETEVSRQEREIVEVLHSAVGHTELHQCFQLLSDDRFSWVCTETRRGKIEQRRELHLDRVGRDRVAETDIDLQSQLGRRDTSDELRPNAAILLFLTDETDRKRVQIEANCIIRDLQREHLGKDLPNVIYAPGHQSRASRGRE